jgi:hypothetical protein
MTAIRKTEMGVASAADGFAAAADRLVDAYNEKDFGRLEQMIAAEIDFAHFNRDFAFTKREDLIAILLRFATELVPDRCFLPPERVTASGSTVVREAYYTGTAQVDLPGFASAGNRFKLKFCSVMRFDQHAILVEWKDYG